MRSIVAVIMLLNLCSPGFAQSGPTQKASTPKEKIQEAKKLLSEAVNRRLRAKGSTTAASLVIATGVPSIIRTAAVPHR